MTKYATSSAAPNAAGADPYNRHGKHSWEPDGHYNYYDRYSPDSPLDWAIKQNYTLSDDFYADLTPQPWHGHHLYLPDYAIGRLVETPAEINTVLDTLLANGGAIDLTPGTGWAGVAGYTFLKDSAGEICSAWQDGGITANCLITDHYSRDTFLNRYLNVSSSPTIFSVNGHATHFYWGTPTGEAATSSATLNATSVLSGALVYAVG